MRAEGGDAVVRIAMWSGPRNISTAMMRAFENRPDTAVVDEPFYGFYLRETGLDHPGRESILAAMDCDWGPVAAALAHGAVAAPVFYQKHMTHHMLPAVDLGFALGMVNCFLLRDPARMIASYARVRPVFTLEELGLPQQLAIHRFLAARAERMPLVVDAAEVLVDPRSALTRICDFAGIAFLEAMLSWPPGPRASDGVWAPHWYAAVEASTGFQPPDDAAVEVPAAYRGMLEEARGIHREMRGLR